MRFSKKTNCFLMFSVILSIFLQFTIPVIRAEEQQDSFNWKKYTHVSTDRAYKGTTINGVTTNDHIVSNGNVITFYGYDAPAYNDFLFMPNESTNKKTFSFRLNEAGINYHSMYGGGFLFNGKIVNETLTSYLLLFENGGVGLYKVGPVSTSAFNNGTRTWSKITAFNKVGSDHEIKIEVDNNTVNMWDNGTQTINNYKLSENIGNGFGPIATYTSHSCSILSYFTFSNLKMTDGGNVITIIPIPKDLKVESKEQHQINVTWSPVSQATSYDIEMDGNIINNTKNTSYTYFNVAAGTTHTYKVRINSPNGVGEWSSSSSTVVLGEPNTWTIEPSMSIPRSNSLNFNVNGKIYIIGGVTSGAAITKSIEVYEPIKQQLTSIQDMPYECHSMAGAVIGDKIYVIGGKKGSEVLNTVQEYNTKTNTWTKKADMPTARFGMSAVVVAGKIYTIGGNNGFYYLGGVEEYDPAANKWTKKTKMPTSRSVTSITAVDNKIYVIGGFNGDYLKTVECYNPQTDTWSTKTDMLTERRSLGINNVNGQIYAVGGLNKDGESTVLEVYNPVTDTWIGKQAMPTKRGYLGFVSLDGLIYAIGGISEGNPLKNIEMYNP